MSIGTLLFRLLRCATASALLAGCVAPADPAAGDRSGPIAADRWQMRIETGAFSADRVPPQWWELFHDPRLAALETAAAERNLDLAAQAALIAESRARLAQTASLDQPTLGGDTGFARSAISENSPLKRIGASTHGHDSWSIGLETSWELDLWGYARQLNEAAEANLAASWYGREAMRVSLAGEVARTYLLLRGTQAQQRIMTDGRAVAADLVRLAESRERNGVATRSDGASARADLAAIDARLVALDHRAASQMNALALLLAEGPGERDAELAPASPVVMPDRLPVGIPSELARGRPDVLQAEARLQAAAADIGAAKADFYPRIRLSANGGLQAFTLSQMGSWGSQDYAIGPTIHLPIFDGGRLTANLALSEAHQRAAAIAYRQTVLHAWHEIDDALDAYASEIRRQDRLISAEAENRTALTLATRAFEQGNADFTKVLLARRTLLASQADLADCATAASLAVVALYRALGGGWSEDLAAGTAPIRASEARP